MTNKCDVYRRYIIVAGASCSTEQSYAGAYQILKPCDGEVVESVHHGFSPGVFGSAREACAAAEIGAREYIDEKLLALDRAAPQLRAGQLRSALLAICTSSIAFISGFKRSRRAAKRSIQVLDRAESML